MSQDKDSKLFLGALIGGIVGIGALTVYLAAKRNKEAPLNDIGEAIAHMGEVLESHGIQEPGPVKSVEKNIRKHEETIDEVMDWVVTGIYLWKKFKK